MRVVTHWKQKGSTGCTKFTQHQGQRQIEGLWAHREKGNWSKNIELKQHLLVGYEGPQENFLFEVFISLVLKEVSSVCQKLLRLEKHLDPEFGKWKIKSFINRCNIPQPFLVVLSFRGCFGIFFIGTATKLIQSNVKFVFSNLYHH